MFLIKELRCRHWCNVTLQCLATDSRYIQTRNQVQIFNNDDIGATYLLKQSILCYTKSLKKD